MTWCYLPDTASPSVQAAADLTWVLTLPSRALPPPVSSSGRNTLDQFSSPRSAPDTSPRPRSGTTCEPLTADRGAGSVTLSLPDTHASRFPQRDSERAKKTPVTSGPMLPGSSTRFSQSGSFLKTSRDTSALALKPCCEPYGTWASRLRLAYSRRLKSVRRMNGSGSSSSDIAWPTPMAGTPAQNGNSAAGNNDFSRRAEELAQTMWTTPQAHDVTARGSGQVPTPKAGNACLATDAMQWGTPRASDAEKGGPNQAFGAGGIPLPAQAAQWPTPAAHEPRLGVQNRTEGSKGSQLSLSTIADRFPASRPAHLTARHGPKLSQLRPIWHQLRASLIASHGRAVWRRLWVSREKARLNPAFVGWLMGWPPGHANCACSETAWFLWQRDMRGALSRLPTASGAWTWTPPAPKKAAPMQGDLFAEAAADQWGAWAMGVA